MGTCSRFILSGTIFLVVSLLLLCIVPMVPVDSFPVGIGTIGIPGNIVGPPSRNGGGQLEWEIDIIEGQALSTPCLVDLDRSGGLEVVVASAGDAIYAIGSNGSEFWLEPYSDDAIDRAGETAGSSGLEFEPTPMFPSVVSADVNLGNWPEIITGTRNGMLCLDGGSGVKQWKYGLTVGNYFSTSSITDLEGDWTGNKMNLELVSASFDSFDTTERGWLEPWETDGGVIFREELQHRGAPAPLMTSAIVSQDLDGDFYNGSWSVSPGPGKERDTELIACYPGVPLSIFTRNGTNDDGLPNYDQSVLVNDTGALVFGTPAIANTSGPPDLEIMVPVCRGWGNWTNWTGELEAFSPNGTKLWGYSLEEKGSGIISSPAVGDIQVDPYLGDEGGRDLELIFGSDNGILYVLSTKTQDVLWRFDTGGRILSSPALCNVNKDSELEIVVGSDSGKVFCLDGDPSDGIDEGMTWPGDGSTYDILWAYNTGGPIGISSPVVADIDLDRQLEVVIGDSEGHLFCISAGGTSYERQVDWPKFHRDLNNTGFFTFYKRYGVDMRPSVNWEDGIPDRMVKSVEPGGSVTFNLTVENTGRSVDSAREMIFVDIKEGSVPEGWSAWLDIPPDKGNDNPGYVMLAPAETAKVTLYVYAPWVGEMGKAARVTVFAVSSVEQNASDSIITLAVLNLPIDHSLDFQKQVDSDPLSEHFGEKWDRIAPGAEEMYQVVISNKGNLNDTYELSLEPPQEGSGWVWAFVETGSLNASVELTAPMLREVFGGISSTTFTVMVKCPNDVVAERSVPVNISAISVLSKDPDIEDLIREDQLHLVVGERIEWELWTDAPVKHTGANYTVEFTVNIWNTGNKDDMRVILSVEGIIPGWIVRYPEEAIEVDHGEIERFSVKVTPPGYGRAGNYTFSVTGTDGDPNYHPSTSLTVIVDQFFAIEAAVLEKDGVEVEPGTGAWFTVRVSNYGNGDDVLDLSIEEMPPDWRCELYTTQMERVQRSILGFQEDISFLCHFSVPFSAAVGMHEVVANISGLGRSVLVRADIIVLRSFDISMTGVDGMGYMELDMVVGEEREVFVSVSNIGRYTDIVRVSSDGIYADLYGKGWKIELEAIGLTSSKAPVKAQMDLSEVLNISELRDWREYVPVVGDDDGLVDFCDLALRLEANATAWMRFLVKAPGNDVLTRSYPTDVTLNAVGDARANTATFTMTLRVLYPDIAFWGDPVLKGERNASFSEGDKIIVEVEVMNIGDLPAKNVTVRLSIDGRPVDEVEVLFIGKGGDIRPVTLSFRATEGRHVISLEIDPENDIIESDDQFMDGGVNDNNVHRTDVIVGPEDGPTWWIWALLIAIFALAMISVSGMVLYKRSVLKARFSGKGASAPNERVGP